jgi:putative Mg2+ transporter-C (MgtC) family protein
MDIEFELIIIPKLVAAFILGAFIGYDREREAKDAGIRTYAAVCLGATLFTTIAEHLQDVSSASRIIANIVMGVGFLGAGIIYRDEATKSSHGLTTAATVWCTAAIGVAVGLDSYIIAIIASLMIYFLLSLDRQQWYIRWKNKIKEEAEEHDKIINKPGT